MQCDSINSVRTFEVMFDNEDVKIESADRIPIQTEDKSTQCNIQL